MDPAIITAQILRISGVVFYFLLFVVLMIQIIGSQISGKFTKIILLFAIVHPLLFIALNYFMGNGADPYAAFVNACLICKTPVRFYSSIGIASFWMLMLSLFLIFKKWKYANLLIYPAFFAIGIHGFFLGTYFRMLPVLIIAAIAYAVILGLFIFREVPVLIKKFREWVKS